MSNLAEIWELGLVCLSLYNRPILNLKQNNFILGLIPPWFNVISLDTVVILKMFQLVYAVVNNDHSQCGRTSV